MAGGKRGESHPHKVVGVIYGKEGPQRDKKEVRTLSFCTDAVLLLTGRHQRKEMLTGEAESEHRKGNRIRPYIPNN